MNDWQWKYEKARELLIEAAKMEREWLVKIAGQAARIKELEQQLQDRKS